MLAVSAAEAPAVEAAPTEATVEAAAEATPGGAANAAAKVAPAHRAVAEGLPAEVVGLEVVSGGVARTARPGVVVERPLRGGAVVTAR